MFLPDPLKPRLVIPPAGGWNPPAGGWKPHTVYLVNVAWLSSNPIHKALLHVGFMNEDQTFGNYCEVWQNSYDAAYHANDAFFLEAVSELIPLG